MANPRPVNKRCEYCIYFENDRGKESGACRRYPQVMVKMPENWCGEFSDGKPEGESRVEIQIPRFALFPTGGAHE
jgi:hypothetical protein